MLATEGRNSSEVLFEQAFERILETPPVFDLPSLVRARMELGSAHSLT